MDRHPVWGYVAGLRDGGLRMTDYNDGKWHGWNGGECPVNKTAQVECRLREAGLGEDGQTATAGSWSWTHYDTTNDIIAFRVVKRAPREWWMNEYPSGYLCIHGSATAARREASKDKVRCIHVREVIE